MTSFIGIIYLELKQAE